MNISLNLDNLGFSTNLKPFTGNFWDIPHPHKLLASKYIKYDDIIFLS